MEIQLRDYQKECIDKINNLKTCKVLVQMATGLGKTVTFSRLNFDRMLIISHRQELVFQPKKYFDCTFGIEMGKFFPNDEKVVSACAQSLVRRLDRYDPYDFDVIIIDEAHHSSASSYKKIINHFKPNKLIGFTATPNRHDQVRLNDIYDEIIYKKDLLWGIKNKYLSDVQCKRIYIDYDLSKCRKNKKDYNIEDLDKVLSETPVEIGKVYKEHAKGQTLIFGVSVEHCENIAKEIPGSIVVSAKTKDREQIIKDFTDKKIPCLVNCMIFTEGTDIPLVETVIIARPTQNESLYTQMVGRGLRLHKNKQKMILIDCVGVSNLNLCTAPTLIGHLYDDSMIKGSSEEKELNCDLFDLPEVINEKMDNIDYWKINYKIVDLWSKKNQYNTHNVNYVKLSSGALMLDLPSMEKPIIIKAPDELGNSNKGRPLQSLLDMCFQWLVENKQEEIGLWDLSKVKRWGSKPASEKQMNLIRSITGYKGNMSMIEASQVLNRLLSRRKKK